MSLSLLVRMLYDLVIRDRRRELPLERKIFVRNTELEANVEDCAYNRSKDKAKESDFRTVRQMAVSEYFKCNSDVIWKKKASWEISILACSLRHIHEIKTVTENNAYFFGSVLEFVL